MYCTLKSGLRSNAGFVDLVTETLLMCYWCQTLEAGTLRLMYVC
jgi:hypothetical protein